MAACRMSDEAHDPILHAPMDSLGYHVIGCAIGGLLLGLVISLGFVIKSQLDANAVSEGFRSARVALMVHRTETGKWPENFDFAHPPVELATRGFTPVRAALGKVGLEGKWSFERPGPDELGSPAIVFRLSHEDQDVQRVLRIVDVRLDDGRENSGVVRRRAGMASLTLKDE